MTNQFFFLRLFTVVTYIDHQEHVIYKHVCCDSVPLRFGGVKSFTRKNRGLSPEPFAVSIKSKCPTES